MPGYLKADSLYASCLQKLSAQNGNARILNAAILPSCVKLSNSTPCDSGQVEERLGPASQSLEALLAEGQAGSFDLAFIGAMRSCTSLWKDLCYACNPCLWKRLQLLN